MVHEKSDWYVVCMGSTKCIISINFRDRTQNWVGEKEKRIRGVWEGVNMINIYEMSIEQIIMRKYFITSIKLHKVTSVDEIDISSNFLSLL